MEQFKKVIAIVLAVIICAAVSIVGTGAVNVADEQEVNTKSDSKIIIHYKGEQNTTPYIYYWNSLPQNIETGYPGKQMTKNAEEGDNWYTYTFENITKVNMLFIENEEQSEELTRSSTGEYWRKGNKWYTRNPEKVDPVERTDLREDTIYFIITTRFYDGDTGNNVHCWDDSQAGNPDSDPAWRGDFKGLIDKLDYLKALGFSAIWVTPVVTNASGYDYHGYHAMDFSTVDVRYESEGATYEDLIQAAHDKDMKIVQDVVFQHSGNFGEATFAPLFEKKYETIQDLDSIENSMIPTELLLSTYGLNSAEEYYAQTPAIQYWQRLNLMKNLSPTANNSTGDPLEDAATDDKMSKSDLYNANNYYHSGYWQSHNFDDWTTKFCQIAGDCVDLNTEHPYVAEQIVDMYGSYINMGVDAFRVDTVRHMPRISLNTMYNKQLNAIGGENFYMFGEVCTRFSDHWYRDHASESTPFYTWDEPDDSYTSVWNYGTDFDSVNENMNLALKHWKEYDNVNKQPTSKNAFLDGNNYHTPDYSESSGMGAIDFTMHWQFATAQGAFNAALKEDSSFNDSTWNVVYVDSHDYSPDAYQQYRYLGGTDAWAENLCLMFTFRGIPCLYYGSEIEFVADTAHPIDVGPNAPLADTGRAYFGDHLEGDVIATDFSEYTVQQGTPIAETLNSPLSKQLTRLNKIRRAIPALQKGQYSVENVSGQMAYKRGYTDPDTAEKSFACIAVTNGATFTSIPNGTYTDAVTGDVKTVTNGTLTIPASGKGNMRVYVLGSNGYTGISGKIGETTAYLK